MRKHQQRQILELLKTLEEAQSSGLYADCQECAFQVGEFIERFEGEDTQTVALLEEYCEFLFKASNGEISEKQLRKQLIKIENSVKDELKPNKIEVVFLPYKVSMWDSFESIWLAAKDDPRCDAYVVAVPYYDRLLGGAFGQMHYEGDLYPGYVPITDWCKYDVEARHPDVIFIHNPYDEINHVTSVHPDFYCKRVKDFTDCLVFIPYAVSSKDRVAEEFAVIPGTVYADEVIVQSETIRQGYLCWFKRHEKANWYVEKYGNAKKKFVALGSPKFDKAINTKREDCSIPDEWRVLMKNTDGTRKKVVLYNTSLNAILHGNEKYLNKLRRVLHTFKNRDDIALLWRPHPLIESTLRSMRPQLLEEYKNIVAVYECDGWGIYDDTPDLHRAIALSDAYYGDWSSLVTLYQCTGKPAVLQRWDFNNKGTDENGCKLSLLALQMTILCFSVSGDVVYLYSADNDAIYRFEMSTKQARLETILPHGAQLGTRRGYLYFEKIKERLIFAPCTASSVVSYDLREKKWTEYSLVTQGAAAMRYCCVYKEKMFFTPTSGANMTWFDLNQNKIGYCVDWLAGFDTEKEAVSSSNGLPMLQGHRLFIPYKNPDGLIEFDCEAEKTIAVYPLRDCVTLAFDGVTYWWANNAGVLNQWNPETGETVVFHDFSQRLSSKPVGLLVYFLAYLKGFILLLPHQYHTNMENKAFKVDVKSGEITELVRLNIPAAPETGFNSNLRCYCGLTVCKDGYAYTYSNAKNTFIRIDPETDKIMEMPVNINLDSVCQYLKSFVWEAPEFSLEHFINALTRNCSASMTDSSNTKEIALSINYTVLQFVSRYFKDGEPDIGVHGQNGTCGQQIMSHLIEKLLEGRQK